MNTAYPNQAGSVPFSTFNYSQQIKTGSELYFPPEGLAGHYKDFQIKKYEEHQLFYIDSQGKVLPSKLAGRFTKLQLLTDAIDAYLKDNPSGIAGLPVYVEPVKRSHHAKKEENDKDTN
jgi:hypothetical protein